MFEQIRDVDTKEFLISKIKENKKSFGQAVVKAVLFRDKNSIYLYEGKVNFLHKSENARNVTHDYGQVVLLQWVINIGQVLDLIESLSSESISLDKFKDVKIKGGLVPECYHVANRYRFAGVMNDWPFWFSRYSCDSNWGVRYTDSRTPIIAPGLEPYPDLYEANRIFLNLDDESYSNQTSPVGIQFFIPDYRARIKTLEIEENQVSILIEMREAKHSDLLLQFFGKNKNRFQNLKDVKISPDGSAQIKFSFTPIEGHLYLLDRNSGEEIDSKSFGRWYTDRTEGIIIKTSKETIESMITKGETDYIEFKMELGKDNNDFLETVVSFANTKGGTILLGIHDDGRVVGVVDDYEKIEKKIQNLVANRCEPDIEISIEPFVIDNRNIIAVRINEGSNKPYLLVGKSAYKRVIKDDYVLTRHDLDEMYSKKQNPRDDFRV